MLGFGQRKGKVRNGEERGREGAYLVDARRRRRPGNGSRRLAEPSPPGKKKGTKEKKATGGFFLFFSFLFFCLISRWTGERRAKLSPTGTGPSLWTVRNFAQNITAQLASPRKHCALHVLGVNGGERKIEQRSKLKPNQFNQGL